MTHSPSPGAVLLPSRFDCDDSDDSDHRDAIQRDTLDHADLVRTERDVVEDAQGARDRADQVELPTTAVTPPARRVARPAVDADDPYGAWLRKARGAGHRVILLALGRYHPENLMPLRSWAMAPNDLLDVAREDARRRVDWVHAVLPDQAALLALHRCVVTPAPRGRRRLRGGPTATPWTLLVAQQHVGLCAISDTRGGLTTHVLEIPAGWLACAILTVGPPVRDAAHAAEPASDDDRPTAWT